jgi:hypothetical protein
MFGLCLFVFVCLYVLDKVVNVLTSLCTFCVDFMMCDVIK